MIYAQIYAFDKNSSGCYSENLAFETKEQLEIQFKNFEENVPFPNWFYEIATEDVLTEEEEEILGDYDYC